MTRICSALIFCLVLITPASCQTVDANAGDWQNWHRRLNKALYDRCEKRLDGNFHTNRHLFATVIFEVSKDRQITNIRFSSAEPDPSFRKLRRLVLDVIKSLGKESFLEFPDGTKSREENYCELELVPS